MSTALNQIKLTLANLSAPEKAELAEYLLNELELGDPDAAAAWQQELGRRMAEIRSGSVTVVPVEEVLARLRERYP